MSRPTTTADLEGTDAEILKIGEIDFGEIAKTGNIAIIAAAQSFLDTVWAAGGSPEKRKYSEAIVVRAPAQSHVIEQKLKDAQTEWDTRQKDYMDALRDPRARKFNYSYQRDAVDKWALAEGFAPPQWSLRDDVEEVDE